MLLNMVGPSHGNPGDETQSIRMKNRWDLRLVKALKYIINFMILITISANLKRALEAVSRVMSEVKAGMGGRDPGLC